VSEPSTITTSPGRGPGISAEQLAEHEGLVRWVVRQQWLGDLPFADALHEGRVGLWRALQGYDPTRGSRFSTYAVPAIARAVWRAVSQDQRQASALAERLVVPTVELPDLTEQVCQAQVRAELRRLVGTLPPRLGQVTIAHYGLAGNPPQSFAAIGQALGLTRQRVQQLHVVALLWLAHPDHSLALRRLLERNRRSDYQQFASRQRKYARTRRGDRRRTK
jgi:RNA polymerase sigma factor (sigma-70 family)